MSYSQPSESPQRSFEWPKAIIGIFTPEVMMAIKILRFLPLETFGRKISPESIYYLRESASLVGADIRKYKLNTEIHKNRTQRERYMMAKIAIYKAANKLLMVDAKFYGEDPEDAYLRMDDADIDKCIRDAKINNNLIPQEPNLGTG